MSLGVASNMAEQFASVSVPLQFQLGLDNLTPETALQGGTLREAVNMDFYPTGSQRTRPGLRQVESGRFDSLFHPSHDRFLLVAKDNTLVRFDGTNFVTLATDINGLALAFAEIDEDVYWIDGAKRGYVTALGMPALWGLPVPPSIQASPVSGGGLTAGTYRLAMTARVAGVESGAAEPTVVQVPEGGGIAITVPTGADFSVYRTPPNGVASDLCWAADVSSGGSVVIGSGVLGKPLRSLYAVPPPSGTAIASYRGRLFVSFGDTLWFTSAYSRHWVFQATDYFRLNVNITMLGASENGLYVGTAYEILFLDGTDPAAMTIRQVSPVGSVSPSVEVAVDSFSDEGMSPARQCAWIDADGFLCVGKGSGVVTRPHRNRYCMGSLQGISLAEIRRAGLRQIVVGIDSQENSTFIQTDSVLLPNQVFEYGATFD